MYRPRHVRSLSMAHPTSPHVEGPILQILSEDNVPYPVVGVPAVVRLPTVGYTIHPEVATAGAYKVHHIYVRCEDLRTVQLPLDANPRRPRKTQQVTAMRECLIQAPSDFVKNNNGLTVLADHVSYDPKTGICTMAFSAREGVCNGGHTYFAIVTSPQEIDPKALVHLEVIEFPAGLQEAVRIEECIKIARARNNNNKLAQKSEANFQGFYDVFKRTLDNSRFVVWHEGDADAIADSVDAEHFIRLLSALDPTLYRHHHWSKKKDIHKSAALSSGSIHNAWYSQMEEYRASGGVQPLAHMSRLGNDLFFILDMVSHSMQHDSFQHGFKISGFYTKYAFKKEAERVLRVPGFSHSVGANLPPPLEVMLVGLFRSNVWLAYDPDSDPPSPTQVGWYYDFKQLWEDRRKEVMDSLAALFADFKDDPIQFIRAGAAYEKDLFALGYGQRAPEPALVYDIETGTMLHRIPDSRRDEATHFLDPDGDNTVVSREVAKDPKRWIPYERSN